MRKINDGGPIHPIPEVRDMDGNGIMAGWNGMSLRDWFAGQALTGLMVMISADKHELPEPKGPVGCAIEAYRLADAMLAERSKAEGR
jgi:hypothetical protein